MILQTKLLHKLHFSVAPLAPHPQNLSWKWLRLTFRDYVSSYRDT